MENLPNEIKKSDLTVTNIDDLQRVAKIFVASGFFNDTKDIAQACVKIMAGSELGFTPMQSMTGVYIVKGKVAFSAALMASAITRAGLKYRVKEHTDEKCEIEYFDKQNESIGVSTFTLADAKTAGLGGDSWRKYPRNMLFARAMSNGARWYCAEAFGGAPVYTPEELDEPKSEPRKPYREAKVELPKVPEKPNGNDQKKKLQEQLASLKKPAKPPSPAVNVPGMDE